MITVLDLGKLSAAVYTLADVEGWTMIEHRSSWEGMLTEGLQAAVYQRDDGSGTAIAFRGTNLALRTPLGSLQDVGADFRLGTGQNTAYFSAAERFASNYGGRSDAVVTGHSLGGAIAQVVGNRMGFKFATFNAPGVAVMACRNGEEWRQSSSLMNTIRTAGMLVSTVADPVQAWADMRVAFRRVHGLNVCLDGDPVSAMGLHYGEVKHIPCPELLPGESHHSMTAVIRGLQQQTQNRLGDIDAFSIH